MDLDPRRLLVLHAIAKSGGLASAARTLGHTRSAVSQQLAALEREVGLPLADRSGGQLELTAAGRLLAVTGERIAQELTLAAQQLITANHQVVRGPVAIGATSWVLARIAVPALRLLARWFPQVEPAFVETGPQDGLRQLRLGELDVLIITDDRDTALPLPPAVHAQALSEDEYRVVVPATWETPADASELSGRPWISAPAHSARGRAFARFASAHGVTPSVEHLADHLITVRALLAGQLGAAVLPAYLAAQLDQVTVTTLPVTGSQITRTLYRTGHGDTAAAARAAVDALQQAARDHAEAITVAGLGRGDIIVRPLHDPADPAPAAPRRPPAAPAPRDGQQPRAARRPDRA
ncbi:LysR family transcriptional regulator [Streptomyces sp. NBC_01387]|uniref:LysR family transcriptional regulator n=1 Tax=unclassified Streptomyces TaxID=2593676 RepID=UPI0020251608|nr:MULTISPECIES: LysR family transcriptional regulator [unclassified Streptomyces]WSC18393.1 LysR family transcriptional regulator [Streptomyces sp. NBC_01766]